MIKAKYCPICQSKQITTYLTAQAQMHPKKEIFNFDRCANCDFVFLNPKVPLSQLKSYYTDYYLPYRGAEAWGKFEKLVEKSFQKLDQRKLNLIQQQQDITPTSLVLDVGCGKPSFLKMCYEQLKCFTYGIDFSDNGWKQEEGTYQALNLQVGEISDLPKNLAPDLITMWHYLEHDYYPAEHLHYLKSISKSNTKLIIEVPNFDSHSRKKFNEHWAGWHTPRHTSLFSPKNLELLLNQNGWKVENIFTYGTMDPYLLYWMSKMEKKGIAWNKNMDAEMPNFIAGMLRYLPKKLVQKSMSLGIMTAIASPK